MKMTGKFRNRFVYTVAVLRREWLRSSVENLVDWGQLVAPEPGCTAIVGVCARLPDVLMANLRCLWASRWPELKCVIAVVDCVKGAFPVAAERDVRAAFPELNVQFLYYTADQSHFAESRSYPMSTPGFLGASR